MFENGDKISGLFETKTDRRGRSRELKSRAGLPRCPGVLDMRSFIMKYYVILYLTSKDKVYRAQLMKKKMMCYLTDNGSSSMSSQMLKVSHVLTYDALGKAPALDH